MKDPCAIDAGELRHLITITPAGNVDAAGQATFVSASGVQKWASINEIQQLQPEKYQLGALASSATHIIKCRWFSPINASYQITFSGQVYFIEAVYNIQHRNRVLVFAVSLVNPQE